MTMFRHLCVAFVAAETLLGTPEPFEKFEEKMKQKWEALEHPAKPGAIDTLSEQEPLSSPTPKMAFTSGSSPEMMD